MRISQAKDFKPEMRQYKLRIGVNWQEAFKMKGVKEGLGVAAECTDNSRSSPVILRYRNCPCTSGQTAQWAAGCAGVILRLPHFCCAAGCAGVLLRLPNLCCAAGCAGVILRLPNLCCAAASSRILASI